MDTKDDNFLDNTEHISLWRPKSRFSTRKVIQSYSKNLEELIETPNTRKHTGNGFEPIFTKSQIKNHHELFHKSMRTLLLWGQCLGLFPLAGLLSTHPRNARFEKYSFTFGYSIAIWTLTTTVTSICLYSILTLGFEIRGVAIFIFLATTNILAIVFIRAASKWSQLVKKICSSKLAVNSSMKGKCAVTFWLINGISVIEHVLRIMVNIARSRDCYREDGFEGYMLTSYPFLTVLGLTTLTSQVVMLLVTKIVVFTIMMQSAYAHIFIINISIYLACVLEEVNKKVKLAVQENIPPYDWRPLREIYTQATQLVKLFDDMTNKITFITFGGDLFYMCYRLYFVLSAGFNLKITSKCPYFPSGPFYGYEHFLYFLVSLAVVLIRSVLLVLAAASVHQAPKTTARILYEVSPTNFCDEVDRFIEQVHNDTVALSGYDFFYVTRGLLLSVTNAIVTYELVLMQFEEGKDLYQGLSPIVHGTSLNNLDMSLGINNTRS